MANIYEISDSIHDKLFSIEKLSSRIKELYDNINNGLSDSNGVITKEIDSLYKEIDATFGKKTKLEQEVLVLRRQIHIELEID